MDSQTPSQIASVMMMLSPPLQAAFETLASCHMALMQIDSPSAFLEKAEGFWHQRDRAIRVLSDFIENEPALPDELHGVLKSKIDLLATETAYLQRHLNTLKGKLQEQRLANTQQRQAIRQYGA
jgi:hypothetical protein